MDTFGVVSVNDLSAQEHPSGPCPISPAVGAVFGKWTTEVLWALTHAGALRFTELRDRVPEVTPKVLTQRLRQLERDGLVLRTYHREVPPRVEYEATALARSLVPIFVDLERWTRAHAADIAAAQEAYDGPLAS